jgi:hypothetical protein
MGRHHELKMIDTATHCSLREPAERDITMIASLLRGDKALRRGSVVVWRMVVDSPSADKIAQWRSNLHLTEQARADRFCFTTDRQTFIAAHALKRALLAHFGNWPAANWRFVQGHGESRRSPQYWRDLACALIFPIHECKSPARLASITIRRRHRIL